MSIVAIFSALIVAASAQGSRYDDCVALIESDPETGRIAARQWVSEGGGADARHCLALADLKAGFATLAAVRLQEIAQRKDAGDDYVRARLLAQAAEAWLKADEPSFALETIISALELVPDSGELQLTAAEVYGALSQWRNVIGAVDAAETAGFVSANAFALRARAYFAQGDNEAAAHDVVNALSIQPTHIDALILRGELQQTGMVIDVYYGGPEQNP